MGCWANFYGMRSHDTPYRIFSDVLPELKLHLRNEGAFCKWKFVALFLTLGITLIPVSMSDNLNSQWGGAFVTSPTDTSIIFLEPANLYTWRNRSVEKPLILGIFGIPFQWIPPESFYVIFMILFQFPQICMLQQNVGYYRHWRRKFRTRYLNRNNWPCYWFRKSTKFVYHHHNGFRSFYKSTGRWLNWESISRWSPQQ